MNRQLRELIKHIHTRKKEIILHILIIFVFPIFLLYVGVIPLDFRVIALVALVSLLIAVLVSEKWTSKMLGVIPGNNQKYFWHYALFTVVGLIVLTAFGESTGHEEVPQWWTYPHFLYLFFVVSAFQEIAYRGYLIPALGTLITHPVWIVIINAMLFSFMHIIFPHAMIMLPLAFVGGVGFALMYIRYPSLFLIILSHAILNFCAVLYGFFVIPGVTY